MKKLKRHIKKAIIVFIMLVAFIYLNNTSLFTKADDREPILLAHRGLAQTFPMEGITGET